MWCLGGLGDGLLIVGIIAAVRGETILGFMPVLWFLLAIISYLLMIWVVALCILTRVESQMGNQMK